MGQTSRWLSKWSCLLLICIVLFGYDIASCKLPVTKKKSKDASLPHAGKTYFSKITNALSSEFYLTMGVRIDELEWSIATRNINVLSELTWSNVDSYQVSIENQTQFINNIYFRGQFSCASIISGTIRDSDYRQNNRTAEWSRSISESTGDQNWDISAGGGYTFSYLQDRLKVSPLIGIAYHKQNLRIQNGMQVVSESNTSDGLYPPEARPLPSQLNSSYFARWIGPWIGCDLRYIPKMQPPVHHTLEFRLTIELGWADYYGEGNWNLRSDLEHPKSFEHEANGFGVNIIGQCLVRLSQKWRISLSANHKDWSTGKGTDRKFPASGGTLTTQLNKVHWKSTSFMAGVAYQF